MIIMKLWQVRAAKGMSLRKLERITGMSRTTINRIENEVKSPTLCELEILAQALQCDISDLYIYQKD